MKTEHKILAFSVLLGILAWVGQGISAYYLSQKQHFWNVILFDLTAREIAVRSVFFASLVALGIIAYRLLAARRQTQESLAAREEKLSVTLQNIADAIITTDDEGNVTFLNSAAQELIGWPAVEATGQALDNILHLVDEQSGQRLPYPVSRLLRQEISAEIPPFAAILAKNGDRRTVAGSATPVLNEQGKTTGVVLSFRDVSERTRTVEALRREKETVLEYLDLAGVMIVALDKRGDVTFINRKGCEILGYSGQEIIGKNWFDDFIPEQLREAIKTAYAKIKREEIAPVEYYENPVITRTGEERLLAWHNTFLTNEEGVIVGTLSTGEDITERKQAAAELQESVERFRAIFTAAEDLIYTKDRDLRFTQVNPSMERLLDLPACHLIGRAEDEAFGIEGGRHIRESDARVLAGETIAEEVTRPINGVPATFHVIKMPIRDTSGAITGLCGIARNITHRKRSEDVLRESEARLKKQNAALGRLDMRKVLVRGDLAAAVRQITETATETLEVERASVWLYDDDRSTIKCIDLYERSRERHTDGISLEAKRYPKYFAALEENRTLAAHDAHSDPRTMEFSSSYLTPNGITAMLDAPILIGGDIAGVICCEQVGPARRWMVDEQNFAGSMADATALALEACERKKAERELKESEEKYRDLVERANDGIAIVQDAQIKFINSRIAQMLGYTAEEMIDTPFANHIWPDQLDRVRDFYTRRMAGEATPSVYETVIRHHDGQPIYVELNAGIIDYQGRPADFVFVRDLTERRKPDKAHDQADLALRQVFHESLDVIMIIGEDGEILQVSRAAQDILGYTDDDLAGKNVSLIFPAQPPQPRDELLAKLRVYGGVFTDQKILRADGSICMMDLTASVIPWDDRRVILASFRDITDRKAAEQALGFSQFSIDHAADAVYWMGSDARFIYVNAAACDALGYSREELLSMTVHDMDPDFPPEVWPQHWQDVKKRGSFTIESHHRTKDGRIFPVEITINYLEFEGQEFNFAFARDISERKRAERALRESEERLRQAQKMEAIGRLASGVAHDFNNLLSIINGYSELLLHRLEPDSPLLHHVQEIHEAGERGGNLTRQLLAFSRKQILEPRVLDLNRAVHGVNKMLRRLIGEEIDLVTRTDPALGAVKADPGQIEQVLLNLAVNARDAMPQGGQIKIKTANVTLGEDHCRELQGVNTGPYVLLEVSDTGHGMDAETRANIFEPFFTTKEPGKGTGLGLSTVYGIIKQSGGHIQVQSELAEGTSFKIYLPRFESDPQTGTAAAVDDSFAPSRETTK